MTETEEEESLSLETYWKNIKRVVSWSAPDWFLLLTGLALNTMNSLTTVLENGLLGEIIDVLTARKELDNLHWMATNLVIIYVAQGVTVALSQVLAFVHCNIIPTRFLVLVCLCR